MANWQAFNRNLKDIGSSLGQYAKQENEKKAAWDIYQKQKEMEFQNAIALEREKLKIQQEDPMYQLLNLGKAASGVKAIGDVGGDISGYGGLFGSPSVGQGGMTPSGQTGTYTAPVSTPVVPVAGQAVDLYASEGYELLPFGGLKPKGLKSRKEEAETSRLKVEEAGKIEASKPYSDKEVSKIAIAESTLPVLNEIIDMVEKEGNIFGNFGLGDLQTSWPLSGQSRLGAFASPPSGSSFDIINPLKRGLAVGQGRKIGNKMKLAVQLAFEKGGANLTQNEIMASLAGLSPENKTEEEWLEGLKIMRREQENILNLTKKSAIKEGKSFKSFIVRGKKYEIPIDKIEEFKKDMGI